MDKRIKYKECTTREQVKQAEKFLFSQGFRRVDENFFADFRPGAYRIMLHIGGNKYSSEAGYSIEKFCV